MVILALSQYEYWWHMGKQGEEPGMQVAAKFQVTNIKNTDLLITGAKLKKSRTSELMMWSNYQIPPGATSTVSLQFWIIPPPLKIGDSLLSDVALIDQHGNKCWIKKIEFRNTQRPF